MRRPDLILMATSAGGPETLKVIIPSISKNLGVPVLLVQHMGHGQFTKMLANRLNNMSDIEVKEATPGERLMSSKVYIAPGDFHMKLSDTNSFPKIEINNEEPKVNFVRPAADVLFNNVAETYKGKNILVVIGTGMGKDGMKGIENLKKNCNCYCITEREKDCFIYGMPKVVDDAGLSDERVALKNIGDRINMICKKGWN